MNEPFKTQNFTIVINNQNRAISRNFEFSNGDILSFTMTLEKDESDAVSDLHVKSVQKAIDHLQFLIGQK